MRSHVKKLIICLLTLLWAIYGHSAVPKYNIKRITNANGLSNSSVNVIRQDSNTLMWFGTWDGLNCWDSEGMRVFLPSADEAGSLRNNVIRDIVEQSDTCLWIVTDRGVDRYNPRKQAFTNYFTGPTERSTISEDNFHLAVSPSGETVCLVNGRGAYIFDGHTFRMTASLRGNTVVKAFFDSRNSLWIHTSDGKLFRGESLKEEGVEFVHYNSAEDDIWIQKGRELREISSSKVFQFREGTIRAFATDGISIFLGTQTGVFEMDAVTGSYSHILKNLPVLSLCCGSQQILWVGTDMHGVLQLSDQLFDFGKVTGLFEDNAIRCFSGYGDNSILVGTKGSGIFEFDSALNLKRQITTAEGLSHNSVFAFAETPRLVWIGTDGAGINYLEKGGKGQRIKSLSLPKDAPVHSVYAILPQGDDTLWVGTSGSGLFRLILSADNRRAAQVTRIPEEELGSNVVYSLLSGDSGHILVGTRGAGISLLNTGSLKAERLGGTNSDDILCMARDSRGQLWAGSSLGLMLLDPARGLLRRYSLSDGLPSQTIHGIQEDPSGNIWASTNSGLASLEPDTGYILSYYAIDGLQDNEFSDGASFSRDGLFYFGGIKGFNRFDPLSIHSSGYDPRLVLKELRVDNNPVIPPSEGGTLELEPDVMSVSFTFTPVDFVSGDRCLLAYKVEGLHKDWIQIGQSRTVALSNLKPGKYNLIVYWTNASHLLSTREWRLPIHVRQIWWKSRTAMIVFLIIAIIAALSTIFLWQYERFTRRTHDAKLDFFTNIAHEFSNSLSLIYGPCQQLRNSSAINGKDMRSVLAIESTSNRMLTLIQQLISFRKAETGHLRISIGLVDMPALIYHVYDNFREQMDAARITFKCDTPPDGLIWTADGDSMEKVVFNLLSNALKYTPEGQTVEVKLQKVAGRMEMDVTNYGVGIPKDKQATIFNRYDVLNRFEKALQKGRTSNGIGLALCQSLVELHNGHIEIISDGLTYTCFHVSVPHLEPDTSLPVFSGSAAIQESRADIPPEEEAPLSARPAAETVLVVDDDDSVREFVTGILSPRFNVVAASGAEEALRLMAQSEPKIVVSDLAMPGMDGLQLRAKMREDERLGHIPFILLTGESAMDTQIKALEGGVDAYIAKPFHPRHLLARIERVLSRDTEVIRYSQSAQASVEKVAGKEIKKADKALLTSITDIILANLDKESLNADMIAGELNISKVQLYRKLKATVDMTTTEYIRSVRLEQAQHLLTTGNMSVQEIMYACGFVTKTYFYREFQKKFGVTPGEFRRSQRG